MVIPMAIMIKKNISSMSVIYFNPNSVMERTSIYASAAFFFPARRQHRKVAPAWQAAKRLAWSTGARQNSSR
jgi:hypothetical protein